MNIADRFIFFLHQIPALAKRRRNSDAVLIRSHGAGKASAVIIVVVHVESDPCDGMAVQAVGLGQLQPALGRLVLHDHLIGLQVVIRNGDFHRKTVVHKMFRDNSFFDLVSTVGQQGRFNDAVFAGGDHSNHFTIASTIVRRDAAEPGDGEFRTRQQIAGQLIFLHDANLALDRIVGHSQISGFVRIYHSRQFCQCSHIAGRVFMFPDGIAALGQCRRNSNAVIICGHGTSQIAGGIKNVELNTSDGRSGKAIRLGQANVAPGGFILHNDLDRLHVILRNRHICGEISKHKVIGSLGFSDAIGAISQQRRFNHTVSIRSYGSDHLSDTCTFMGGDAADPADREFCTSQQIASQLIFLHNADFALDWIVGHSQISGFVRMYHSRKLDQFSDIPNRILMLADGVASFGKCWRNCKAAFIRSHGANQCIRCIVDVKLNIGNGHTVHAVRFGQANVTLGRHIAHLKGVGHAILIGGYSF